MTAHVTTGAPQAAATLTDTATITREAPDPAWTPDRPASQAVSTFTVWEGPGSLGTGPSRAPTTRVEPDRIIGADTLRTLPPEHGGPDGLHPGDQVTFAQHPGRVWLVADTRRRTTRVLQRVTIVDAVHAGQVPR